MYNRNQRKNRKEAHNNGILIDYTISETSNESLDE